MAALGAASTADAEGAGAGLALGGETVASGFGVHSVHTEGGAAVNVPAVAARAGSGSALFEYHEVLAWPPVEFPGVVLFEYQTLDELVDCRGSVLFEYQTLDEPDCPGSVLFEYQMFVWGTAPGDGAGAALTTLGTG